jgi:hypothetical protein
MTENSSSIIDKLNILIPPNTNSLKIAEPRINLNILDAITILNYIFIIIIQLFPGLICTVIFNYIFIDRTEEEYNKISTVQIFIELVLHLWFILILYYIFKLFIVHIKSPFDNLYNTGFQNKYANETQSGYIFSIVFIICQSSLRTKISVFKNRLFTSSVS